MIHNKSGYFIESIRMEAGLAALLQQYYMWLGLCGHSDQLLLIKAYSTEEL